MTNQARIQAKVWRGYAQAAKRLGTAYQFSRPIAGSYPGTALPATPVSLNAEDMKYSRPNKYGKATAYALFDGTGYQPGDYLVGPQGTYFVAAMQPLLPILVVQCNRTVTLSRVANDPSAGAQGYGGMTTANETAYAAGFPCSILQGTKGERNDAGLPADTRLPWWTVLMPAAVGSVRYGDLIVDDLGTRYVASSVERTDLGYRVTAGQAVV